MWLDDLNTPARLFFSYILFLYILFCHLRDIPAQIAAKDLDLKIQDKFQNIYLKLTLILGWRLSEALGRDVFGTWCVQRFPENIFYRYIQVHYWPVYPKIKWLNRQRTDFIGCFYYVLRLVIAWYVVNILNFEVQAEFHRVSYLWNSRIANKYLQM